MGVGKAAKSSAYWARTADSMAVARSTPLLGQFGPQAAGEGVGLLEAARGAELDDPVGVHPPKSCGKMPREWSA